MSHPVANLENPKKSGTSRTKPSYVILQKESFEDGIKRIVNQQVASAIHHLTKQPDIHEGVHDARRALKITRAAYRLIRLDLKKADFSQKNDFYSDIGRQLSELRDLTALLETLDIMEKKNPRMRNWKSNHAFRKAVELRRNDSQDHNAPDQNIILLRKAAAHLLEHRERINQFQLSNKFTRSVLASLRQVYARGFNAYKDCQKEQHPESMHEWRKRAKYLRYHFRMLRNVWPEIFTSFEKELHLLTDYLGDFNNLSVMRVHLNDSEYELKKSHRSTLLKEAIRHQDQLGQSALDLGVKLYTETPKAFERRMKAYFSDQKILK